MKAGKYPESRNRTLKRTRDAKIRDPPPDSWFSGSLGEIERGNNWCRMNYELSQLIIRQKSTWQRSHLFPAASCVRCLMQPVPAPSADAAAPVARPAGRVLQVLWWGEETDTSKDFSTLEELYTGIVNTCNFTFFTKFHLELMLKELMQHKLANPVVTF